VRLAGVERAGDFFAVDTVEAFLVAGLASCTVEVATRGV